ncbi:MAG TPA: adenylate kinase [Desulfurobacteriaceae bacterium]|nr:adenylate kinase [Desulfurobacteriaceae bacterium]
MIKVVFLGPPGAGKGTQAKIISQKYNIPLIVLGDILREAVKNQTELGKIAKKYMDKGELVPDEIVCKIIKEALIKVNAKERGFILDGFPRTLEQAKALEKMLKELDLSLDKVLFLDVPDEELIKRMLARGREDDTVDIIKNRLKVYYEKTTPVINYYEEKGILEKVDGLGDVDKVTLRIEKALGL